MVNEHFFPSIEPYATGELAVDDVHTLYWEQCGNPEGEPVVFLHGGPGAGSSVHDRRFFDPGAFRIVLFDQRGCGRSRPLGELRDNDIANLVADIETVRAELGIETWHVFGGSWGSTLAMCYAQEHALRVRSLVLRGIWMLRKAELDWWLYGIRNIQPELWREFAEHLPEAERDDLLEGYWRRLTSDDRDVALAAARHWSVYEGACCTLLPNEEFASAFAEDDVAWAVARLEAQFFRAAYAESDDQVLGHVGKLRGIPAFAVHGRYDIVCPVRNLDDLSRAWPELDCVIVPDAGHSSHEAGITRELVAATSRVAATGSPVRTGEAG